MNNTPYPYTQSIQHWTDHSTNHTSSVTELHVFAKRGYSTINSLLQTAVVNKVPVKEKVKKCRHKRHAKTFQNSLGVKTI